MARPRALKIVLASLLVSSIAGAETKSTVTLGGSVTSTLGITTAGASTLVLSSGQKIAQVADVSMITNNDKGLTLTATSGSLTKVGGTAIAFQVTSVGDGITAPLAAAFTVASGTSYTVATSAAGSLLKDLYMMYTPGSTQNPGAYAGSIIFTVTDN